MLVGLGVPVSLLIEWIGDASLSHRWFDRLSSPMRIMVAIPIVLVLGVGALALVRVVRMAVLAA